MYTLSRRSQRQLRQAKHRNDAEVLEAMQEEVLEQECERWASSPQGRYGLPEEGQCDQMGPQLVRSAWAKLKQIARQKVVDVMDDYEDQHNGPPQFDTDGERQSCCAAGHKPSWVDGCSRAFNSS